MEAKPKISRYLIIVVLVIFSLLSLGIYGLLSSEDLTKYAITTAIEKFIPPENLNIRIDKIEGCLLEGIKIEKLYIRHIKPNFEVTVDGVYLKPLYNNVLNSGEVNLIANIDNIEWLGGIKLTQNIASIPAFIGYECFAGLPSNIKIQNFCIKKLNVFPYDSKELEVNSENINFKYVTNKDFLDVKADFNVLWKKKKLAKAIFDGNLEQKRNKLSGNLNIDIAKQKINSEITLNNSKKGLEINGYIASDTFIDLQPLSQWLGYLWQKDYPYAISGKIYCQGSWFYNTEIGLLGNLNGEYKKVEASLIGLFFTLFELNGKWKFFDNSLNITDTGSKIVGVPAELNGKIESVTNYDRKWNISLVSNSIQLEKLTSSIPWVIKYSQGIPDLIGVATFSANLLGNRPMISAKAEFMNLAQLSNNNQTTRINGKAYYSLPEIGSGTFNSNFVALSEKGLPLFFKRFPKNFYEIENTHKPETCFTYSLNGSLDEIIKLKGSLKIGDTKVYETSGEIIEELINLRIFAKENRIYNLKAVDPIDLFLMR